MSTADSAIPMAVPGGMPMGVVAKIDGLLKEGVPEYYKHRKLESQSLKANLPLLDPPPPLMMTCELKSDISSFIE